nr:DUF6466 family protein [Bifidobacterium sp. SMB2]
MLAGAAVAALNISSLSTNNTAVAGLNAAIADYAKDSPDLGALRKAQQQNDAQFADAQGLSAVQLPQVRRTIADNAAQSARLTKQIEDDLNKQKSRETNTSTSDGTAAKATQGKSGKASSQDTAEAEKIDRLLKQNSQGSKANVSNTPSDTSKTEGGTNRNAKPW